MLPLRELREHERVFVIMSSAIGLSEATSAQSDSEPRSIMRVRNKQLAAGLILVGVAAPALHFFSKWPVCLAGGGTG